MITRRQWNDFIWVLRQVMGSEIGVDLWLHGQRISHIDENNVIHTGKIGEPNTIYSYRDSLRNVSRLWELYADVNISPTNLWRFRKIHGIMRKVKYDDMERDTL